MLVALATQLQTTRTRQPSAAYRAARSATWAARSLPGTSRDMRIPGLGLPGAAQIPDGRGRRPGRRRREGRIARIGELLRPDAEQLRPAVEAQGRREQEGDATGPPVPSQELPQQHAHPRGAAVHLVDDEEGAREADPAELGVGHPGHRAEGLVDRADRDPGGRKHAALPLRPAERPALAVPDVEWRDGCHVVVTGHGEHDLVCRDAEPHGEPADAVEDFARGDPGRQSEEQGVAKAEREQAGEQDEGRLGLAAAGGVLGAEQGARSDTDLEHRALQGRQRRLPISSAGMAGSAGRGGSPSPTAARSPAAVAAE